MSGPPSAERILVYGVTGSGKSTTAHRIATATGLPLTLVDELTWEPGWVPVDTASQRERIRAVVSGRRWVLDNAYGKWADLVLDRVDLIVCLDFPRLVSLGRLVRRTVRRIRTREFVCNQNVETVGTMLSPDSILVWHFRSFGRKRRRMRTWAAAQDGPEVLLFRSTRELEAWLRRW
ncbi:hypothetical protein [Sciscionella sediminilitoris]|uniref:hypothetical protein n=1 Tax=Sciscionella sediminilitoris TaxID=1445613 RepID=UPI0004DF2147|nr:hypothetical protein [Sciscionella sp. SE31]